MLDKAETEGDSGMTQEIKGLLVDVDRTGKVPASVVERPGEFLRRLYEAWYENGGLEGGKPRNSIRRMRNEWLKGKNAVPSLHPKLTGQIKLNRFEVTSLVDLFLAKWEYVGNRRDVSNVSREGYIQFPASDNAALSQKIVEALFCSDSASDPESLLLPDQSIGKLVQEDDADSVADDYQKITFQSDTSIMMSRQKTVLGPNSEDTARLFWHYLSSIYNYDKKNNNNQRNLIWIISSGERYIEEPRSVAEFFNIGFLFVLLRMFISFHSQRDQSEDVGGAIARKLWLPETTQRHDRARWLRENAAIIVQNLDKEIFKKLHPKEVEFVEKLRLKDTDITPEHVFPSIIPSVWTKPMRSIYKKGLDTLDQSTITIHLGEGDWTKSASSIRYAAHSGAPELPLSGEGDLNELSWQFRSTDLQSPGNSYDEAAQIVRSAAAYRLRHKGDYEVTDESIALAYLHKLGYRILSLDDFFKIFSI